MVIRPNGYGIWERMQRALDDMFKATGHVNAYFPLFIPRELPVRRRRSTSRASRRSAPSSRMGGGKELEERLVVRPTSETIIYSMFAKWVQILPRLAHADTTSGPTWSAGRCAPGCSCARWSSCGRKGTRRTPRTTRRRRKRVKMLGVYREFMEGGWRCR
jgi:prolyl-tRNA synthetase